MALSPDCTVYDLFEGYYRATNFVMLFVHFLNFSTFVSGNRILTLNIPRCPLLSQQLSLSQFLPLPLLTTQLHPNKFNVLQERGGFSYINRFPQQNSVNISEMSFQLVSMQYIHCLSDNKKVKVTKSLYRAWTGPVVSRRFRLPDFETIGTWIRMSALHTARLYPPRDILGTHFG